MDCFHTKNVVDKKIGLQKHKHNAIKRTVLKWLRKEKLEPIFKWLNFNIIKNSGLKKTSNQEKA